MCFPYPLHCSVNGEQPVQEPASSGSSLAGLRSKTCLGRPGGLIASCSTRTASASGIASSGVRRRCGVLFLADSAQASDCPHQLRMGHYQHLLSLSTMLKPGGHWERRLGGDNGCICCAGFDSLAGSRRFDSVLSPSDTIKTPLSFRWPLLSPRTCILATPRCFLLSTPMARTCVLSLPLRRCMRR